MRTIHVSPAMRRPSLRRLTAALMATTALIGVIVSGTALTLIASTPANAAGAGGAGDQTTVIAGNGGTGGTNGADGTAGSGTSTGGAGGTTPGATGSDGTADVNGGGGGGGGASGADITIGTLNNAGSLTGNAGGAGGNGGAVGGGGGGGGGGGSLIVTGSGVMSNSGTITGGAGGNGGLGDTSNGSAGQDGTAGVGGTGLIFMGGVIFTNTASGTVAGGRGSTGGTAIEIDATTTIVNAGMIVGGTGTAGYDGLAILVSQGDLTLTNSNVIRGSVGGIVNNGGLLTLNNSGQIYSYGSVTSGITSTGLVDITNSGGIGGFGGPGIYAAGGTVTNLAPTSSTHPNGWGYGIFGAQYGIYSSGAITIYNASVILSYGGSGVDTAVGGTIANVASGVITGGTSGLQNDSGLLTVTNSGQITATSGTGISIAPGGSLVLTNNAGTDTGGGIYNGTITGSQNGIYSNGPVTVTNSGAITSTLGRGISSTSGVMTVTNNAGDGVHTGLISGADYGIFNSGNDATIITNAGTIFGGTTAIQANGATTISNTGTIAGGTGIFTYDATSVFNDGAITGTGGTAIQFAGGGNALTLGTNSQITGSVIASSNDTLQLGGTGSATFDVGLIGVVQYQGFSTFNKVGSSIWTLDGTPTAATSWNINGGTLSVASDAVLGIGNAALSFNGGTLQVTGTGFTSTTRAINWGAAGGGFDIADVGNTFTLSQALNGSGGMTKAGAGTLMMTGANNYSGGTTISAGTLQIGNGGTTGSLVGNIANNGALVFNRSNTSAFDGVISGTGTLQKLGAGTLTLSAANTYTGATTITAGELDVSGSFGSTAITNNSILSFIGSGSAGSATITNASILWFGNDGSNTVTAGNSNITNNGFAFFYGGTAANAVITNNGDLNFYGSSTADNAAIVNNGSLFFSDTGTAGNAIITTNNGGTTYFGSSGSGGAAQLITNAGGSVDISALGISGTTAGSIAGAGNYYLGAKSLTVGGNGLSTEVSGVIQDGGAFGGTGGSLTKTGTGTLTLSGINTYTGLTTVDGGTLSVNGDISASSGVIVNAGGTLGGNGIVGDVSINGGTLSPGNSIGTLTVTGTFMMTAASTYLVQISGTSSDKTVVTGPWTATLAGKVVVNPLTRLSATTTYTILDSNSLSGTFDTATVLTSFARNARLSYVGNSVLLTLDPGLLSPNLLNSASVNQKGLAAAIDNALTAGATMPSSFNALFALTGDALGKALTQASGETATGTQQVSFNAMTQFMALMTDPFSAGRGFDAPGAMSYAEKRQPTDAFAMFTKAPLAKSYDPRWSVWASGFGGSQTTSGTAAAGSNTSSSSIGGTAVGADVLLSPNTIAGFSLAGGGTNFSVANGGSGHSDMFQMGAFVRHSVGSAYVTAAAAYGWQDITTDRTVTIAGIDRLHAEFNANTYSGRIEVGNRSVSSWLGGVGVTPYLAAQVIAVDLPSYAESTNGGATTFALAYGAKTVISTRSELGLRGDKSFSVADAVLTLRGRAAWAYDYNTDRSVAATFQALPGASFTVSGAAAARDAALTTASAEMNFVSGISLAATFEGEFSDVTRSYSGRGTVRYAW